MKTLIIEDERPASNRLKKLINDVDPSLEILDVKESVSASVKWFNENSMPDLIFMDIQLSDGLSFEIFKHVDITCPVIFTTAFDQYAIQAFKVNSIDYLMKPIETHDLKRALNKFTELKSYFEDGFDYSHIKTMLKNIELNRPAYKARFLIKSGQAFIKINSEDIAYFYVDNKLTYLITFAAKKHLVDYKLEELERQLDPKMFFRANRQFITNIDSILDIHSFFSGKLKVHIKPPPMSELIVSRDKASAFKTWMES